MAAWIELFGKQTVIYTSDYLQKGAEGFGYKVIGKDWSYSARGVLRSLVPTDDSVVSSRSKELSKPKIIPDTELTEDELINLKVLRYLVTSCDSCINEVGKPKIVAAVIPPIPGLGTQFAVFAQSLRALFTWLEIALRH